MEALIFYVRKDNEVKWTTLNIEGLDESQVLEKVKEQDADCKELLKIVS